MGTRNSANPVVQLEIQPKLGRHVLLAPRASVPGLVRGVRQLELVAHALHVPLNRVELELHRVHLLYLGLDLPLLVGDAPFVLNELTVAHLVEVVLLGAPRTPSRPKSLDVLPLF